MRLHGWPWLILIFATMAACGGLQTREEVDQGLGAPPPEDSPAVVAQASQADKPRFASVDPTRWSQTELSKTGVVFAWTLTGSSRMVSEQGCRLRVRHRESGDTVLLKLDGRVPVSIQQLKPGTWDAKRLGCGLTRIWDLEDLFRDGFVVKQDSISVIGWFVFAFDERTLVTVREGGREENTRLAQQLVGSGPKAWPAGAMKLVSGFSGKDLPSKIDLRDEIVRVKASGLADSDRLLHPLLAQFQSCASAGMKVDPLRAGTLRLEVMYKGGKYDSVRTASAEHAMRDDFVACLVKAHEGYSVSGVGDFTLETTY